MKDHEAVIAALNRAMALAIKDQSTCVEIYLWSAANRIEITYYSALYDAQVMGGRQ
jgi:hypothetical protein